ncbi:carbamoyl-phosphate synthase large subunit [Capsaspora owczarzaki ATCC 30864]|uniref:Carbamoyl phosphate synthase arginine-specific large chain n=1 Tax=Capsaspora owczarzaki (strain ATCC 30864) TaxID=595528 RepID=A0A0D2VXG2_CAPO3|nr:carbamoyl-phosphate synthase large subunit [Capsaspora owczarzaki ATCC 30864]KJE96347.1 carbamoyl-phosphate synthase large subunit [Capsaspora owczarzaki ATCC 30864]|eukprot:XP_004344308.1 carbamoyl-phosphate synthase large subunit [Capsaspora owczarzaki ATCC 30864]
MLTIGSGRGLARAATSALAARSSTTQSGATVVKPQSPCTPLHASSAAAVAAACFSTATALARSNSSSLAARFAARNRNRLSSIGRATSSAASGVSALSYSSSAVVSVSTVPTIMQKSNATLVLDDGSSISGVSFGAPVSGSGEVVFSTAMVGYPESLTDPSYSGQILVITQPLVGNYGVPSMERDQFGLLKNFESDKIHVSGVIVSDYAAQHSHETAVESLQQWLVRSGVPAISGVDTRALVKRCRDHATLLGKIVHDSVDASSVPFIHPGHTNQIALVSRKSSVLYNESGDVTVLAVDCGIKTSIIRCLAEQGARVKVVPWDHDILNEEYDALFLSNGPGDPLHAEPLINQVRTLIAKATSTAANGVKPIFGICMGNQIIGRAAGLSTFKMRYGNRGHNVPAVHQFTGQCIITSQNHGYAVSDESLAQNTQWKSLFRNANDNTNEGLVHVSAPIASVQFHPEAAGGPLDSTYLFKDFVSAVRASKSSGVLEQWAATQSLMHCIRPGTTSATTSTSALPMDLAAKSVYFPKPSKPTNIRKVLVLGSGGLSIGQAGEFDYSGSQCIKALKEEGVQTILLNPNIATIQTGSDLADAVYFLPVNVEYVDHVLRKEKPDSILLTFGGQTALNTGVECEKAGVFTKHGVRVLGTPITTLITSEDRDLFAKALGQINEPVAVSQAVSTVDDALAAAASIGYPVIIRSAFALGGLGSGFADTPEQLSEMATRSLSLAPQILVERSMKGWKEVEYEVVRDAENNCITVCNMENFDPLGIHTGDSIVVAPSQTLTDKEYHSLRAAAIRIIRHLGVVGECNVQYALNPKTSEYCVIEVNARLSRSSALASKATGYPLAFVAAKIALGHSLPTLRNSVTQTTTACFEPSLDYIVCKIPRWDLTKFDHVSREIGSCMKSVGEVMAIGRTFEEVIQKALRMVDPSVDGFMSKNFTDEQIPKLLSRPTDQRIFVIANAMKHKGYTVDQIYDLTKIDKWFLHKLDNIVTTERAVGEFNTVTSIDAHTMSVAKKLGFSDKQIAKLLPSAATGPVTEIQVRQHRKSLGVTPIVKQIDTLAGEFPAQTNYLYVTYNASVHDVEFGSQQQSAKSAQPAVMVLGSGNYRIGSSVEFDWCAVSSARALRKMGRQTIMVNYNPETVSTDYDECDRLYFEEISLERVLDIYDLEQPTGVIVSMGGQVPQNIALPLYENGVKIVGTSPLQVDMAEDRNKFSTLLDSIGVEQPEWSRLSSMQDAHAFSQRVGYPVLVRPSYVLSGAAMNVAYSPADLERFLGDAVAVSPLHPVVITKFINSAMEIDIDGVARNGELLSYAVSEHVENAGVHSGDATLVLPSRDLTATSHASLLDIARKIAVGLKITGPFNMQVLGERSTDGSPIRFKVIECNLRASRSFPFVSKTLGVNMIDMATRAMVGEPVEPISSNLLNWTLETARACGYQAVKVPQFSFTRLAGADPMLGVEMASTGEVACFGKDKYEAYMHALMSTNAFRLPKKAAFVTMDNLTDTFDVARVIKQLSAYGLKLYGTAQAAESARSVGVANMEVFDTASSLDALRSHVLDGSIDLVVNLAEIRAEGVTDVNYRIRRMAVDHNVPLVTNAKCAAFLADALVGVRKSVNNKAFQPPVYSWQEYTSGAFDPAVQAANLKATAPIRAQASL